MQTIHIAIIRASLGLGLLALAFGVNARTHSASAVGVQYAVLPGHIFSGQFQFGAHFDEGVPAGDNGFLARDFNSPSDGSTASAAFRMTLAQGQSPSLWFVATHYGSCGVQVQAGWWNAQLQWQPYTGQTFNYVHIANRVANLTWVGPYSTLGASANLNVGTQSLCQTDVYHLHQSGDVSPSIPVYRVNPSSGETCWTNYDGSKTWQCPATYRLHAGATTPSVPGGICGTQSPSSGGVSGGVLNPYQCQNWSSVSWSASTHVFQVIW